MHISSCNWQKLLSDTDGTNLCMFGDVATGSSSSAGESAGGQVSSSMIFNGRWYYSYVLADKQVENQGSGTVTEDDTME